MTSGEKRLEFFAGGLDDFFGALAKIYEDAEGHRDDSATILRLALTSLRFLMRDCFATRPQSSVTC